MNNESQSECLGDYEKAKDEYRKPKWISNCRTCVYSIGSRSECLGHRWKGKDEYRKSKWISKWISNWTFYVSSKPIWIIKVNMNVSGHPSKPGKDGYRKIKMNIKLYIKL